jgi:acyl-CoA hydrolase
MSAATALGATDWRALLGAKLVSPEQAVSHIRSGDRVTMSIAQATPYALCAALAGRLMELENVVVNHAAALVNWDLPGLGERFRLESNYLSPLDRELYLRGDGEFTPISYYREGHLPPSLEDFNIYMMTVSPCRRLPQLRRSADHVEAAGAQCEARDRGDRSAHGAHRRRQLDSYL